MAEQQCGDRALHAGLPSRCPRSSARERVIPPMSAQPGYADDRLLWDLHVSGCGFQAVMAADALGIFAALRQEPATAEELATQAGLNRRAVRAVLPQLAALGLLAQRLGRYHLTETARAFLLPDSPYYWGPVLTVLRLVPVTHAAIVDSLKAPESSARWDVDSVQNPSAEWSSGEVLPRTAKVIGAYMNANCLRASQTLAQVLDLRGTHRLLDVGAGSGCFSIEMALANPTLRCSLMDLKGMGEVAMHYVRAAGVADRIDTVVVDMFRQDWPRGYDAVFLSNIFHDWDFAACALLAKKAYEALPVGGRIYLHEMLLDDTHDAPAGVAAFSMYMLIGTKGQQFTASELRELLMKAGFVDVRLTSAHGYFFLVSAEKR